MLHLSADYLGTAITPFTAQPSPDEETNRQLVEDLNLKISGSTWAALAASPGRHPTAEGKLPACSAPRLFCSPGAIPDHPGEGVRL